VDSSLLRRWIEDKRAAEARERSDAHTDPPSGRDAIAQVLALISLYGRLHGWPPAEDEVSRREAAQMYDCWHRLRVAFRGSR